MFYCFVNHKKNIISFFFVFFSSSYSLASSDELQEKYWPWSRKPLINENQRLVTENERLTLRLKGLEESYIASEEIMNEIAQLRSENQALREEKEERAYLDQLVGNSNDAHSPQALALQSKQLLLLNEKLLEELSQAQEENDHLRERLLAHEKNDQLMEKALNELKAEAIDLRDNYIPMPSQATINIFNHAQELYHHGVKGKDLEKALFDYLDTVRFFYTVEQKKALMVSWGLLEPFRE